MLVQHKWTSKPLCLEILKAALMLNPSDAVITSECDTNNYK